MNKSIKVTYVAFNQVHELLFPVSYTVQELANYLRLVCNNYVIMSMQPTSKEPTI